MAISRMRCAMNPCPLATTRGACMLSWSYLRAMANSVGLVTTTSALGTSLRILLVGRLHGDLPAALLDLGVAVHAAHFVFDFLLAHFQFLLDSASADTRNR